MQKHPIVGAGSEAIASAFKSRRNFLFAGASVVAVLPAAALLAAQPKASVTDEQQLEACLDQLKSILDRMNAAGHSRYYLYTKTAEDHIMAFRVSVKQDCLSMSGGNS